VDAITPTDIDDQNTEQPRSWRDVLPVHPAAELFPLMEREELIALADDIKKNGMQLQHRPVLVVVGGKRCLLDGRNRLDALEYIGVDVADAIDKNNLLCWGFKGDDPYAVVVSANIQRRHLTAEQKREIIRKVIEAQPTKSNREIARQVKASPTIVGQERDELSKRGQLPDKTIGKDGRARPARRPAIEQESKASRPPTTAEQAQAQIAKAEAVKATAEAQKAKAEAERATAEAQKAKVELHARMFPAAATNGIPSASRERLLQALRMLASESAAERAEAAAAVERERAHLNMTWAELIVPAEVAEAEVRAA
jgi:hypothetical protein